MKANTIRERVPVGTRVLITGNHPHTGKVGYVARYEVAGLLDREGAVVNFDDGLSGFVFNQSQLKPVDGRN